MATETPAVVQRAIAKGREAARDPATSDFVFNQTMMRIKDPEKSVDFYTRVLGMKLLCVKDFPQWKFSLFFVGYADEKDMPEDEDERARWAMSIPGVLELTYNYGTESDDSFKYHSGNEDPRGFGHIGIAVPDVQKACDRFEELGVEFRKRPQDGNMSNIAFLYDPDHYWIEILPNKTIAAKQ